MLLLLFTLLTGCSAPVAPAAVPAAVAGPETAPTEIDEVAFHEIWKTGEGVFLDVRTPEEFAAGHVPGAVLIPVQVLESRLAEAEAWRDQTIYVYCRTSNRSGVASRMLREAGFERVVQVRGGITDWKARGFPTER